jgi:hypothetical protein
MYLELPDLESFIEELKAKKLREVRIVPFYQQIPNNPVNITNLSVILTATDRKDIIKYEELIGREPSVFKDQIEALGKKAAEFMDKITKAMKELKIETKKGIYKYPSEING